MASIEKRITADGKTTYRAKVRKKGYRDKLKAAQPKDRTHKCYPIQKWQGSTAKILIPCQNAPRSRASA